MTIFLRQISAIGRSGTKGLLSYDIEGTAIRVVTLWSLTGEGENNRFLVQVSKGLSKSVDQGYHENRYSTP